VHFLALSPPSAKQQLARFFPFALSLAIVGCDHTVGVSESASPTQVAAVEQTDDSAASSSTPAPASEALIPSAAWDEVQRLPTTPQWIADAVFYQIFPERFRNGDAANDPTHDSLESPELIPQSWKISPWTGDWYARSDWEVAAGPNFFDNGVFNRRYGGDLQGVLDKLDYLQKLGVNTLYFNPVFFARSLHKYDGASMHHIDPYFGPDPTGDLKQMAAETSNPKTWQWTAADKLFLKLIAELHERNMHIIIDGVFNHTGRDFFAFADLLKNQEKSPYRDWYIVQRFDDPATPQNEFAYKGWWNVATLPEFADAPGGADLHPGPKAYLMDITRRWMDPDGDGDPADGVDGWRLDVANEVPIDFWKDWNKMVFTLNPQAYTTTEIWDDARQYLTDGGFSATMNYYAFAYPAKGYLIDGRLTPHDFGRELAIRRQSYPAATQFALQNLVDSHDTERIASIIVNRPTDKPYENAGRFDYDVGNHVSARHDPTYSCRAPNAEERRLQRMVALLQMTYVGAPMIYYGDEAGMWGGDDPCDRLPMVWEEFQYEPQARDPLGRPRPVDAVAFDRPLFDFYAAAIALRNKHDSLRRGSWAQVAAADDAKFFAFRRDHKQDHALVAFNRGDDDYLWQLPDDADPKLAVALSTVDGKPPEIGENGGHRTVVLPPLSGLLLITP
jgi:glycosidase